MLDEAEGVRHRHLQRNVAKARIRPWLNPSHFWMSIHKTRSGARSSNFIENTSVKILCTMFHDDCDAPESAMRQPNNSNVKSLIMATSRAEASFFIDYCSHSSTHVNFLAPLRYIISSQVWHSSIGINHCSAYPLILQPMFVMTNFNPSRLT